VEVGRLLPGSTLLIVTFALVIGARALRLFVLFNAMLLWMRSTFFPYTTLFRSLSPEYVFSPGFATFTQPESFSFIAVNITCGAAVSKVTILDSNPDAGVLETLLCT